MIYLDRHLLVKDFKPKYMTIEYIFSNEDGTKMVIGGICFWIDFKRKYGNERILSVMDYDDTLSTSIIIEKTFKYN